MRASRLLIAIAGMALLAPASFAQHREGAGGTAGAPHPGAMQSGPGMHGSRAAPRANPGWENFRRGEPRVRTEPHRFGSSVLPMPNRWRGNARDFDRTRWDTGQWRHERHNGRLGWWWVIGADWHFFVTPIYPYPDSFVPPGEDLGWWYWCDEYQEYYPYVTTCPDGWDAVLPRD